MEQKVSVNNTGIESAGLTTDYMQAIAEYIWNGFDAGATSIDITFDSNALDYISIFSVTDNGSGIDLSIIGETFGNFMDSIKKTTYQKSSSAIRGNMGKGRFSFVAFSGKAVWTTRFLDKETNKILEYTISIRKNSKDKFDYENRIISKEKSTGTTVTFSELFTVTGYSFSSPEFLNFLGQEFGWFLFLNKDKGYKICINGVPISYTQLIAESEILNLPIKWEEKEVAFKITFIRWNEKIGDKFYFYFLDAKQREITKELTSFNNNAIGFNHSVYIESPFFDGFSANDKEESLNLFDASSKSSPVFKTLLNTLHEIIRKKQKEFVSGIAAEKLIESYEKTGVIPKFKNNKYDQARKSDLVDVVKGIYCVEPKIFQGLNKEQQKISVGLINILLDTDERDTIIDLIGEIVNLTGEERAGLLDILKKTTIAKIAKTINLIENRFKVIELLRALVFDLKKFTSEISHLQKVIEESFWLFGEQYHLVSANESFTALYNKYIDFINGSEKGNGRKGKKAAESKSNRRPDVFLCKKRSIPDVSDHQYLMEENVIVELKRPTVPISKEQVRQVEDYLEIIRTDDSFNSQKRCWKFLVIGNQVDNYVLGQYESQKEKGKKFLVKGVHNYEIYALTWDDIFMLFDLRHKFLVDNLEFDRDIIKKELIEKGINLYGETSPEAVMLEAINAAP